MARLNECPRSSSAAAIVPHGDRIAHKSASCNNNFQLVKLMWTMLFDILPLSRTPQIAAQVQPQIDCAFTMEAEVAESGGASGLLVIIDNKDIFLAGLYKMPEGWVSSAAETFKDDSAKEFALVELRMFKNSGNKKINLPCLGEVTVLSMGVLPFCLAFSIFWAANQHTSYAWVGKIFWIPRFFDSWGGYDIILFPGLLVAFAFRNDRSSKKGILNGYFLLLAISYDVGGSLASYFLPLDLAAHISIAYNSLSFVRWLQVSSLHTLMGEHGQPALLYLLRCTLDLLCKYFSFEQVSYGPIKI
ncbi:hypothetical protein MKW92_003544 [Papaver armeniacum]|nr:hypothetical protein MKW92_003544 [Papaver armeniacum]